jgi:Protease inhibitor Inh
MTGLDRRVKRSAMHVRHVVLGACLLVGAVCSFGRGARAEESQPPPPAPPASDPTSVMVGAWEFSNADRDKVCRFNFRADTAPGGYRLDIDKNCASVFPSTKDIAGWSLDTFGTLRLLDARGNAAIELTEAEAGIFDGFQPGEGRYVLQSAAAAPVHSVDDMVGDWGVARGTGKPICILTLVNSPAGTTGAAGAASADTLALKVKPGCDPLVTRFGPVSWRIGGGELVLLSARGQAWRFEEDDADTWLRVPESADPVLLVRQEH